MNSSLLISVIVPVYNVEQYLDECIRSILNQTYSNIEIILVDDGSKDSSGSICDSYGESDGRVTVIHKENGGLSDARNAGLKIARGEYILFVDSDDYITPDACESFCNTIVSANHPDIIIGNAQKVPGDVMRDPSAAQLLDKAVKGTEYISLALKNKIFLIEAQFNLYRRDFLNEHRLDFEYGILHEDVRFTLSALCKAESVVYLPTPFYFYRYNPNSIMNRKDYSKNCRDIYDSCLYHEKFLADKLDKETYALVMNWLVKQYLGIYRKGKCYQYGKEYTHKAFVMKYAGDMKTRAKAALFFASTRLYCKI